MQTVEKYFFFPWKIQFTFENWINNLERTIWDYNVPYKLHFKCISMYSNSWDHTPRVGKGFRKATHYTHGLLNSSTGINWQIHPELSWSYSHFQVQIILWAQSKHPGLNSLPFSLIVGRQQIHLCPSSFVSRRPSRYLSTPEALKYFCF